MTLIARVVAYLKCLFVRLYLRCFPHKPTPAQREKTQETLDLITGNWRMKQRRLTEADFIQQMGEQGIDLAEGERLRKCSE